MDPFWGAFFAFLNPIVVAILAHLKNVQQDTAAMKRDLKINTLEAEIRNCHDDRERIEEELKALRAKPV